MNSIVSLFTSVDGRINRAKFWLGAIIAIIASLAVAIVLAAIGLGEATTVAETASNADGGSRSVAGAYWSVSGWASFFAWLVGIALWGVVAVKRRHDRDASGWDVMVYGGVAILLEIAGLLGLSGGIMDLASLIRFVLGLALFVTLGFLKGTNGPNQYGPDPLGGQ